MPRRLLLVPGVGISVAMTAYFGMVLANMALNALAGSGGSGFPGPLPEWFFWVSVPMYWLWGIGLGAATISYARRTRQRCRRCDR